MSQEERSSGRAPARVKPALSIRARVLVLVALAIAPLLFDRIRLLHTERADRIAAASEEAISLAHRGIEAQQEIVLAARSVLQVIARGYAVGSPQSCDRFIAQVGADVPWMKSLLIIGLDGRISCSNFPNTVGLDLSDRAYFQQALRTGDFVLSDYLFGRLQQAPTIVAALPLRGPDATVAGVIATGIDLEWIGRLGDAVTGRKGMSALLIDGKGVVLARHPGSEAWIGRQFAAAPLVKAMLASPTGTITVAGLDGTRRIFGFLQIPETNARIAVGLDEHEVLGRIDGEMWFAYVQLGSICVLALFAVWFGGERLIVRPIRSLVRAAARIGRGKLEPRLAHHAWAAEFAPLATALDDMARCLAAREEELRIANAHLEELASIDGLSGLPNRRSFDAALNAEWRRAAKIGRPLALLMIDVDHFKPFNDRHGHVEGDECLRLIGEVIGVVAANESYFGARYGGEEFALLLPDTHVRIAIETAEQLRRKVEELHIAHAEAPTGFVTISVGIASLEPKRHQDSQVLVQAADAALYAAKRRGRNLVVAECPDAVALAS
jgi:diguanylate cyclase (GGDEF)-like protein